MTIGLLLPLLYLSMPSCQYNDVVDTVDYPEPLIYLPLTNFGILEINSVDSSDFPKYTIDFQANRITIPVAVYRSGFSGLVNANINIQSNLEATADFSNFENLPQDQFSHPISVNLPSGADNAIFEVTLNLDFLLENDNDFILAIEVLSDQVDRNPEKSILLISISPDFLKSKANFSFQLDESILGNVVFENNSTYASSFFWDFGDGNSSTEESPEHTYESPGTYLVSLNTIGLAGNEYESVFTREVVIE